jgi:hypothetical protein
MHEVIKVHGVIVCIARNGTVRIVGQKY